MSQSLNSQGIIDPNVQALRVGFIASFTRLIGSGSGSATIKSGQGSLHGVILNAKSSAAQTLTLYDNAVSGVSNVIGAIDLTAAAGSQYPYHVKLTQGLSYLLGASNGATDLTILWR